MTVYQNSTSNLGVKLEITHASPDVANNRTTITYKASVYKTGSHNPWNALSQTPMYLTINGQSLHSTAAGNYDLRGGTTSQLIKSGTLTIPHDADGSKSFTFSWNVNFTSTGYGYGNVTTSGTYVLPNIARASTFTIPSTTITTGSAFTVTITRASDSFTHKVSYIVGNSENVLTSSATTSYSATVPHSLFNSHKSTESVSGVIRVTTMNGSVEVGSNQRTVTINLVSSAKPSLASVSYTNSNKGMFTGTNQFIRNVSLPTITAGTATGSYSSTISSYEFQTLRNTSTVLETVSKTANSQQFGAFNFPTSGSEAKVFMQARVRDSRGRYSAWVKTAEFRVHHYAPPAIGAMTVRRTGSGNTTLQVTRNYVVLNMFEGGGTTNSNTASLSFQHRTKGTTAATNNTGAKSTTMSLTNSNANLAGTFAANTSYEVRAVLTDKLNTVYGSWISVGTEFVPMDIGSKGVGIGKIHSDGTRHLEVGTGGIYSYGPIASEGLIATTSSGHTLTLGSRNASYAHYETSSPSHYFNKKLQVAGDVFGGTSYNRKLAYQDEVHASFGNSTLTTTAHIDNMVTPGVYQYSGSVFSDIDTYGLLIARVAGGVATHNGTNTWLYQTAYATAGNIYQRTRINAGAWSAWTRMPRLTDIPHTYFGVYSDYLRSRTEVSTSRILSGIATASGNATSTFNSLGNTVTFPIAFSSNTNYNVMVTYSISSNVTPVNTRMISVNIRDVTRTGFVWDARDAASGTSPSGGTVYTLHWIATGVR